MLGARSGKVESEKKIIKQKKYRKDWEIQRRKNRVIGIKAHNVEIIVEIARLEPKPRAEMSAKPLRKQLPEPRLMNADGKKNPPSCLTQRGWQKRNSRRHRKVVVCAETATANRHPLPSPIAFEWNSRDKQYKTKLNGLRPGV